MPGQRASVVAIDNQGTSKWIVRSPERSSLMRGVRAFVALRWVVMEVEFVSEQHLLPKRELRIHSVVHFDPERR